MSGFAQFTIIEQSSEQLHSAGPMRTRMKYKIGRAEWESPLTSQNIVCGTKLLKQRARDLGIPLIA